ncbi:MAG: hypothetical protein MI864_02570 [Pseudomonadales bacterium]|uniref:Uncharacterized protein n=1 Tax=Oleiphilus messinensis TaxID=141451 RepID=A0A1Y0IEM9_9GAMM|nr:hypothetical protein [Oleiphilus messinensis]ARU58972.1 hypothetical protein OLMES_4985 [Oleiphilus messinensis]MCG8609395.1 hypothetical protein [Pseudomonadales bacterium]
MATWMLDVVALVFVLFLALTIVNLPRLTGYSAAGWQPPGKHRAEPDALEDAPYV